MTKKFNQLSLLLFTGTLFLLGFFSTAKASEFRPPVKREGRIVQATCHMGSCSWFKLLSVSVAENQKGETVVTQNLLGGSSKHQGGYPNTAKGVKINWSTKYTSVATCSKKQPRLTEFNETRRLNLRNFPRVEESAVVTYLYACHTYDGLDTALFGY